MRGFKHFMIKLGILLVALTVPLLVGIALRGSMPADTSLTALDQWSPVQEAGPTAKALSDGIAWVIGVRTPPPPDWMSPEDQADLQKAREAGAANNMQEMLGHLLVISGHVQEKGKTLRDFLPLVMPDIVSYVLANTMAPILLGALALFLVLTVFAPWIVRRLIELLRLLTMLTLAIGALVGMVILGFAMSGRPGLVYGLIEYMAAVTALLLLGNLLHAVMRTRRSQDDLHDLIKRAGLTDPKLEHNRGAGGGPHVVGPPVLQVQPRGKLFGLQPGLETDPGQARLPPRVS